MVYISFKSILILAEKGIQFWCDIRKRERPLLGCYFFVCDTLMFLVASNPSSWLRSSSIVLCTSLSPPEPPSRREDPMESISSMKMIDGACSRAITKSSRTIRAPGGEKRSEGCCTLTLIGSQSDFLKGQLTLSNKLLDQFRAGHSYEGTVSVVGHSSG